MIVSIARWLHTVALSLWLGGLVAIGALVAPTAFHVIPHDPALAGGIVGGSLRLFNNVCLGAGLIMLCADGLLWRDWPRASALCLLLTVGLLALTCYLQWGLFPALDAAQASHAQDLFQHLHVRYEGLSGWELPTLLVIVAADAVRGGRPPV